MLKDLEIDGIYVVHAKKSEDRKKRIEKLFNELDLAGEFVTDGDPTNFSEKLLQRYFIGNIEAILSKGIISCTLNHFLCYEKAVAKADRYALVFENDPYFLGDFIKKIEAVAKEAASLEPGFIISLENTSLEFPSYRETSKGRLLYEANRPRCAGAYLIDLKAAKDMLENLKTVKCGEVIDLWHRTVIRNKVVKMYWAHPPLVEQGSHNGLMYSSISGRGSGLVRRVKWLSQKFYKMYMLRWFR